MRLRALIALLLIMVTWIAAAERQPVAASANSYDEQLLTGDEEHEAHDMAVRLMKRLQETGDFDPLVSEFFVNDFVERIRQLVYDENPQSDFFVLCDRAVILQTSGSDLRRTYLALMNFWNLQELLGNLAWDYVKARYRIEGKDARDVPDAWGEHLELKEEAVPEEAFRIAQSDPMLDALFNLLREDKGLDNGPGSEEDEARIKAFVIHDVARLRGFTDKLDTTIPLLRSGTEKLRAAISAMTSANGVSGSSAVDGEREFRVYRLESERVKSETLGLRAGTILIRARIYPYEMALARVEGQLKTLAVYPDFDGD